LELAQSILRNILVRSVADGDARAFRRQAQGDSASDAARATGDQRNSVAQCHSHPHFTKLEFLSIA
jgi:hypothetical protein